MTDISIVRPIALCAPLIKMSDPLRKDITLAPAEGNVFTNEHESKNVTEISFHFSWISIIKSFISPASRCHG